MKNSKATNLPHLIIIIFAPVDSEAMYNIPVKLVKERSLNHGFQRGLSSNRD